MAAYKVKLNHRGMAAMLRSPEVQAEVHRRAEAVASAARGYGQDMGDGPLPFKVVDEPTPNRARSRVIADHPGALNAEAKHSILTGALDAAGS